MSPARAASSRTQALTIEPRIRTYAGRRYLWTIVALPVALITGVVAVRDVARIEATLAAEGASAARVLVYDLRPGEDLRVAIEPGTEVIRVVAHAVRRGGALSLAPHPATIDVVARGDRGETRDRVSIAAPGVASRVAPEEADLSVGDPAGFDVDVRAVGSGELALSLGGIADAEGLLVRVYRREALDEAKAARRARTLEEARREHLAAHAWEIDWVDLEGAEQRAIVGARWRKIAAYHGRGGDLRAHAIALAPPSPPPHRARADAVVASVALEGDERATVFTRGPAHLRAVASEPSTKLTAALRHADGHAEIVEGAGELTLEPNEACGVEVGASEPGVVTIRAPSAGDVDVPARVPVWRATPARPVIVAAGEAPLVLRVSARAPVARSAREAAVAFDAVIEAPGAKRDATSVRETRARSAFDRYDEDAPTAAPTESAVLHVLVPARGKVTIAPRVAALDVALSELDPSAPPMTAPAHAAGTAPPVTRRLGDSEWGGFVARRPSNAAAFAEEGARAIRVARRLAPASPPDHGDAIARVPRPKAGKGASAELRVIDGRTFERVDGPIDVRVTEGAALPLRLVADGPMDVVATIDDGAPLRRAQGAVERVTVARRFVLAGGESRATVVLGDDLRPGLHTLTISPPHGKALWVHAPWTHAARAPHAATPAPRAPRWVAGDFEE